MATHALSTPLVSAEPRQRYSIPHAFRRWILAPGSLTAHLSNACQVFSVQVLYQGKIALWPHEAAALHLPPHTLAHGRIVLLCCDGQPVVLARTVLSFHALKRVWHPLSKLGNRPLAELLFSNVHIQRSPLSIYRFGSESTINQWIHRTWNTATHTQWSSRTAWARQSCFRLRGGPMLVTECFEPKISFLL